MREIVIGRLLIPVSGFLFLFVCSACAQESQESLLEIDREIVDSHVGDVDIRGRVVSENGTPLSEVAVKYYFRDLGDQVSNRKIDYKRIEVDGDFRISRRRISSVNLSILKDGYYPEIWSFAFHPEVPRQNPGGVEKLDIEIVLQKEPIPVALKKHEGILGAEYQGPVLVVGVKRQTAGETWLIKDGKKQELSWPYVYLEADQGKNSRLPAAEFKKKGDSRARKGLGLGWLRFNDLDDGDGFVVYDPGEVGVWPEIGMRGMTEAPESGYQDNLELSAARSPSTVYFYFKVQGNYGKGMVTGRPIIALENDREVARAALLLYLNPNGSRNVSYLHD